MRALLQRVLSASVVVNNEMVGHIEKGWFILFGVHKGDEEGSIDKLVQKVCNLRGFEDEEGKMNRSIRDIKGQVLVVSQFTLYGSCKKGNRPSFTDSMAPEQANELYEKFVAGIKKELGAVQTGRFGADMKIDLRADGPVTLMLEHPC